MDNEIQAFDFMAAAEDTGRRLDEMAKRLPGEIRADLVAEYRQSPWQKSIPATADRLTAAAERAETATGGFERKIKIGSDREMPCREEGKEESFTETRCAVQRVQIPSGEDKAQSAGSQACVCDTASNGADDA